MLLGKICQKAGEEDILSEHKILSYLETPCDSQTIKSACFSDKLRKIVYGAVSNGLYILCNCMTIKLKTELDRVVNIYVDSFSIPDCIFLLLTE